MFSLFKPFPLYSLDSTQKHPKPLSCPKSKSFILICLKNMKIQIQTLSTETITPSSKTPDHLKTYKLSFLDQINPPVFMPLVLFYPHNNNFTYSDISNNLKKSLSETLSLYYPLAGRLVDNNFINCNDLGITCVEAKANCSLSDIINDPIPQEFNKFLPFDLDDVRDFCMMMIQFTLFECGGFAVGIGMSHKVADAWSILMFINSWAATARGGGAADVLSPEFVSDSLFPAKDLSGFSPRTGMVKLEEVITKRFVFAASKISELRDKYTDYTGNEKNFRRPTRIEALSAFIWTRFMLSTQSKTDTTTKIHTLLHAVNMRTRMDSPSSDRYFGNISRPAIAVPLLEEETGTYSNIVEKIREAISGINGDYVKKLRDGSGHLSFLKDRAKDVTRGEVVSFSFTSLCRFPLYEADFGSGKPVWVGSSRLGFKNLVCFLDSLNEGDIEAWVSLKWEDMDKFERDEELLDYVS